MSWYEMQDNDDAWQQKQREEAEKAALEDQEAAFIRAMLDITELKYLREKRDAD